MYCNRISKKSYVKSHVSHFPGFFSRNFTASYHVVDRNTLLERNKNIHTNVTIPLSLLYYIDVIKLKYL